MSKAVATNEVPDTKRRLLDAATGLMMQQGFTATSVDEICEQAKLTKGSFFHYFKSKEEIGEGALDHYFDRQKAMFFQADFNKLADPLERLNGLLDFIAERVVGTDKVQGCLMGNLTQELALTHPRIRASCNEKFTMLAGMIEGMLREARTKQRAKTDFDPKSVATLFVSLMQGSMLLAKVRQDKSVLKENLGHFRAYVDALFTDPKRR